MIASLLGVAFLEAQPLPAQSLSGSPAPGFTLSDSQSAWHDLVDYRGRWLILAFMKTNCVACNALSKTLEEVKSAHGSKIEVLAIVNANTGDAARYISENNPTYPVAFGSTQFAAPYLGANTWEAPRWFLIDPRGVIVHDWPYDADGKKWV